MSPALISKAPAAPTGASDTEALSSHSTMISVDTLRSLLTRYRSLSAVSQEAQHMVEVGGDNYVTSITHDSRSVVPYALYVALAGRVTHGARFIPDAIAQGATAIALPYDTPPELLTWMGTCTHNQTGDQTGDQRVAVIWLTPQTARREMAWLSAWVYRTAFVASPEWMIGDVDRDEVRSEYQSTLSLIGITGTNGKTTTSTLLADILTSAEGDAGLIGTIETRGGRAKVRAAQMTTMESTDLHAHYRALVEAQVKRCVMEVSSIGIEEERVNASRYHRAAFLNLSADHLDYHGNMERYGQAKLRLFSELLAPDSLSVICVDEEGVSAKVASRAIELAHAQGSEVWRCAGQTCRPVSSDDVSTRQSTEVYWRSLTLTPEGMTGEVVTPRGTVEVRSPLIGRYNASNIAVAVALAKSLGVASEVITETLSHASVRGRMECVDPKSDRDLDSAGRAPAKLPKVRVDYAHSPDALRRAIIALSEHRQTERGRVWVLFGCGGGRDRHKRPLMGGAAAVAHGVVLTSDNPRDEDPHQIMREALAGCLSAGLVRSDAGPTEGGVWMEIDRGVAIHRLIAVAHPDDQILIAGKGHEPYQELRGGLRVPMSDQDHVAEGLLIRQQMVQGLDWSLASTSHIDQAQNTVMTYSLHSAALCRDAGGVVRTGSHQPLSGAAIDTRKIERDDAAQCGPAFFCLRGVRDGHDFIGVALEAGASAIVVRRDWVMDSDLESLIHTQGAVIIEVSDPERALALWAQSHRRRVFSGVLIGLTGSNGKTSTKDLLASALRQLGATLSTAGNFNNHLGVPLTLLRLRPEHRFAVIEMGMNAPDEIRQLTTWADPDVGVITTIGPAHLERLGSLEAVARAKGELISAMKTGPVIMPHAVAQDLRLEAAYERLGAQSDQGTLGNIGTAEVLILPDSDREVPLSLLAHEQSFSPRLTIQETRCHLGGSEATLELADSEERQLQTQLLGRHQLENARLALAASLIAVTMSGQADERADLGGSALSDDPRHETPRERYAMPLAEDLDLTAVDKLLAGIAMCPPAPLRGQLLEYPRRASSSLSASESATSDLRASDQESERGQLWLDCYNANPQSVLASLRTFLDCGLEGALVLGSIGELGVHSDELHYELGREVAELISEQTSVFTVGDHAAHLRRGLLSAGVAEDRLGHFLDTDSALEQLAQRLRAMSPPALLVKGSRSVQLERIIPLLNAHPLSSSLSSTLTLSR